MGVKIYHNARCSKSRITLQALTDQGLEPEVIKYLEKPPSKSELQDILRMLGMQPRQLMRQHETEYSVAGADNIDLSSDQLIDIMLAYPKLIERPIVVKDGKAAIGRPVQQVLDIL